jgi:hypothetical protein
MKIGIHRISPCVLWALCLILFGCQPKRGAEPVDVGGDRLSPASAPAVHEFEGPGITLSYPVGWEQRSSDEYALVLVPAGTPDISISLDIPKLPPHIPGLIPLGMVVSGYTDDLKKLNPATEIDSPVDTIVAEARARRVRSMRNVDGKAVLEIAVLTVHGDRVYIFRANSDADEEDAARTALDQLLASVKWD